MDGVRLRRAVRCMSAQNAELVQARPCVTDGNQKSAFQPLIGKSIIAVPKEVDEMETNEAKSRSYSKINSSPSTHTERKPNFKC